MERYDKVSSLTWLMASIAIIVTSIAYPLGTFAHPGPSFLPLLCGIFMGIFSLIVFIQAVLRDRREPEKKDEISFLTNRWPKLGVALIILFAYAFLLEFLGYLVMTFLFMLFVLRVVEPTRWRTTLIEAVVATGFSYCLFELWLQVPLPKGFWPGLFY